MMTIDTMIYIILAISGIATVSLYLNIYCAIKLHNTIDQSNKLDSANDAIENLHLENMKLIERVDQQKRELTNILTGKLSVQSNSYYKNALLGSKDVEELKGSYNEYTYTTNIKTKKEKGNF